MTETSSAQPSLSTMRLAELQALAGTMGLKGISRMRKSELIAAIRDGGVAEPDAPLPVLRAAALPMPAAPAALTMPVTLITPLTLTTLTTPRRLRRRSRPVSSPARMRVMRGIRS